MEIKSYDLMNNLDMHPCLQVKENFDYDTDVFNSPREITAMLNKLFQLNKKADEYVYMLSFNTKGHLLAVFELSHGLVNRSLIDARGVFLRALLTGSSQIILVHNHPTGITTPSGDDKLMCLRISEVGELMGLPLIDNIIIGGDNYFSFKEHSLL